MEPKEKAVRMVVLLFCIVSVSLFGQSFIDASAITGKHDNFQLYYLEDEKDTLTYEKVKQRRFTHRVDNRFTLGFLDHPVWFKLNLHNPATTPQHLVFALHEVFYDEVSLFYEKDGELLHQKSGVQVDLKQREINNPNAHFHITLPPEQTTAYYVKARPFFATFGQFFLYEPRYYHNRIQQEGFFYTFYLGAVLVISFYNLFLYFYLRNKVYLYYFGYSFCFGLWAGGFFGGMAFYYIPIAYNYNLHVVTPLALLFLMLFSNEVLEVRKHHPRLFKVMEIHHYLLIMAAILIVFYDQLAMGFKLGFEFTNVVAGYIFFFYIYFALKQITTNNKIAKLYLTAIGVFLISITVLSLMTMGVLPNNFYTRYGFLIGSFLEIILLSLLLAYRIDVLQKNYQQTLKSEITHQTNSLNQKNAALACIVSEKDEPLREMFHRVKNNFQILISMLYLEIANEPSKTVTHKIENTISKLQSMAIVHDMLYGKSGEQELETEPFFNKLASHLDATFHLEIENFYLESPIIKNLGLIVNELFTNGFKYTLDKQELVISIKLIQQKGKVYFEYIDNTQGYNGNKSGYGTEFINETLHKLTNVHITINTQNKVHYVVEFGHLG
jgi:two-component sensor histidine kinase